MSIKQISNDYFRFSRKDRIALLVLLVVLVLIFLVPALIPKFLHHQDPVTDTAWMAEIRKLEVRETKTYPYGPQKKEYGQHYSPEKTRIPATLFEFDPNTIGIDDWHRLGLSEKTSKTIINYISKGGRFRSPDDLGKIYGLSEATFIQLRPYVRIAEKNPQQNTEKNPQQNTEKNPQQNAEDFPQQYASRKPLTIDINTADTNQWKALPGIGSKLSSRIVLFREKLGGFHSVAQVSEIYGLQDSVFQKILPYLRRGEQNVKKLDINAATLEELANHPYIRKQLAQVIIAYRTEHGPFQKTTDLLKVMSMSEVTFNSILPYLEASSFKLQATSFDPN